MIEFTFSLGLGIKKTNVLQFMDEKARDIEVFLSGRQLQKQYF